MSPYEIWSNPAPPNSSGIYGPKAPISASPLIICLGNFPFCAYDSIIGEISLFTQSRAASLTSLCSSFNKSSKLK